jgi:hypothetical protein
MPFKSKNAARAAAHGSWVKTPDRSARTAPARAAMQAKREREVDPDGLMTPQDRAKAAENLRMKQLLVASQKAVDRRQAKRAAAIQAESGDAL